MLNLSAVWVQLDGWGDKLSDGSLFLVFKKLLWNLSAHQNTKQKKQKAFVLQFGLVVVLLSAGGSWVVCSREVGGCLFLSFCTLAPPVCRHWGNVVVWETLSFLRWSFWLLWFLHLSNHKQVCPIWRFLRPRMWISFHFWFLTFFFSFWMWFKPCNLLMNVSPLCSVSVKLKIQP